MYRTDAHNALRTALADFGRAHGIRFDDLGDFVEATMIHINGDTENRLGNYADCHDDEDCYHEDTPCLDTTFHDIEMDIG